MKLPAFLHRFLGAGAPDDAAREAQIMRRLRFTPMGEFDESDIFVCGWPKSGNTWCQRLFSGVVWGLDTKVLTDQLAQFLQPDVHYKPYYYRFGTPTLFKSHLPPQPEYRRVIFLIRDGRDALVSYWRMLKKANPQVKIEDLFYQGDSLSPCAWETHARAWLANPFQAKILTVRYEDILASPLEQLRRVASFIRVTRTDDELSRIAAGANLEKMKWIAERHGWDNASSAAAQDFLGAGRTGSFREAMPSCIQEAFQRRAGDTLKQFGYA